MEDSTNMNTHAPAQMIFLAACLLPITSPNSHATDIYTAVSAYGGRNYKANTSILWGTSTFDGTVPSDTSETNKYEEYICNKDGKYVKYIYEDTQSYTLKQAEIYVANGNRLGYTTLELLTPSPVPPYGYNNPDYIQHKTSPGTVGADINMQCHVPAIWTDAGGMPLPQLTVRYTLPLLPPGDYELYHRMFTGRHTVHTTTSANINARRTDNDFLAWLKQHTDNLYIFPIRVTAACTPDATEVALAHGTLPLSTPGPVDVSTSFSLSCTPGATANLELSTYTTSDESYPNALGVDLGNGWNSALSISDGVETGRELTLVAPDSTVPTVFNITVTSSLIGTQDKAVGSLEGLAILTISTQ